MLSVRSFAACKGFAPEGSCVLGMGITQDEDDYYWRELKERSPEEYRAQKLKLGKDMCDALVNELPHLKGRLSVLDVHTPLTYTRFTGAYKGAWMAFRGIPKALGGTDKGELSGLDNLYISGQWLQGAGGLPVAAAMGLYTVQRICKREGMKILPPRKERK